MSVMDYEAPPRRPYGGVQRGSVTLWLIVANVLVYLVDPLLAQYGIWGPYFILTEDRVVLVMAPLKFWGHFSAETVLDQYEVWRFISFQFLHAGLGHLVANMFGLFFFGPLVESYLGARRFLAFYLLCGIAGPVAYLLLWWAGLLVSFGWIPLVGASAGIFGILIAAARIAPNVYVMLLLPPIPMKLKTLAWVLLGVAVFTVLTGLENAGGEAAHLGGAVVGYFLIRRPNLLNFAGRQRRGDLDTYG